MINPVSHADLLLATADQSREADRQTIESFGIPGQTLMEIAGNRAADIILENIAASGVESATVLLVCGKGNNAGDAFVIARILVSAGHRIALLPVFGTNGLSDDAGLNYNRLMKLCREMEVEVPVYEEWPAGEVFDLIVDAVFGTGLEREVKSPLSDLFGRINRSGMPVCALDIPSGIHSDTGEVMGIALRAEMTLQFGIRKAGCYLGEGPGYCGERRIVSLPFPPVYKKDIRVRLVDLEPDPMQMLRVGNVTTADDNGPYARVRKHKYNNGVVHVIGGSAGLTGAPVHAGKAAWSLGMGAVSLHYPSAWAIPMESLVPQLIKKPWGGAGAEFFTEEDADVVLDYLREKEGVTVIGPGLGRHEQTMAFVRRVVARHAGPMIIDADALHAFRRHEQVLADRRHPGSVILTPHPGELAAITGKKSGTDYERLVDTRDLAGKLNCVVLAKGNPVIVHSSPESTSLVTSYDTNPFSRAGFGDILAGHLAAFLTRTRQPLQSCELALVYGFKKLSEVTAAGKSFPEPSDLS